MKLLALALVALTGSTVAAGAPAGPRIADEMPFESRAPRPMRRSCNGPSTWAQILTCMKVVEPTATVDKQPSKHTQVITSAGSLFKKLYLQREDGKWTLVQGLDLSGHELTERAITVGKHQVLRIDLRVAQHNAVVLGDLLRVKTVFTCGVPTAEVCTSAVLACEYFVHGRATSAFLGELEITEAGIAVTGDRTHAAPYCER